MAKLFYLNLKYYVEQTRIGLTTQSGQETEREKVHSTSNIAPFTHPSPETSVLSLTFLFLFTTVTLPFLPVLWDSILLSEVLRCHTALHEEFKGSVRFEGLLKAVYIVYEKDCIIKYTVCWETSSSVWVWHKWSIINGLSLTKVTLTNQSTITSNYQVGKYSDFVH